MHMNIYVFFQNLNILCIFWSTGFWSVLFFFLVQFGSHFWVDWFDDRSGSDNTDSPLLLH
jgi:hypothetical protein